MSGLPGLVRQDEFSGRRRREEMEKEKEKRDQDRKGAAGTPRDCPKRIEYME